MMTVCFSDCLLDNRRLVDTLKERWCRHIDLINILRGILNETVEKCDRLRHSHIKQSVIINRLMYRHRRRTIRIHCQRSNHVRSLLVWMILTVERSLTCWHLIHADLLQWFTIQVIRFVSWRRSHHHHRWQRRRRKRRRWWWMSTWFTLTVYVNLTEISIVTTLVAFQHLLFLSA